MKAVIITIGDELLIGQTIDTNAAWIGQELNKLGIQVEKNITIRDNKDAIKSALNDAFKSASIVLSTGGLGPTNDDITKETLADYFNSKLVMSERVLERVKLFVKKRGFELNDNNKYQALVPDNCEVLDNPLGTAPVMKFKKEESVLFSMPGVPFEMKEIMKQKVLPDIKSQFILTSVFHKTVMTYGMAEAYIAEKIKDWENKLPAYISLAYLPSPEVVKLRLSVYDTLENPFYKKEIEKIVKSLENYLPDNIYSLKGESLPEVIHKKLKKHKLSISTAESCTGGRIASIITALAGASDIYSGSIIAYSNNVKEKELGVNTESIEKHGAVSEEVVYQMLEGLKNRFDTEVGIAVSGIAGPGGGDESKPVGTTWIAVRLNNQIQIKRFVFGTIRDVNIKKTAYTSFHLLYNMIRKQYS